MQTREYFAKRNIGYTSRSHKKCSETAMSAEIKELNRIVCKQCDEKDYEKCKNCRVYQLVNKLVAR